LQHSNRNLAYQRRNDHAKLKIVATRYDTSKDAKSLTIVEVTINVVLERTRNAFGWHI